MIAPIAVQLYSIREQLASDFHTTINKIAEIGFYGVEPWAGLFEHISIQEAASTFKKLELEVISTHSPLPLENEKENVLATLETLNCTHIVSPWMDPKNYRSEESIAKVAETFNQAFDVANNHGLQLVAQPEALKVR